MSVNSNNLHSLQFNYVMAITNEIVEHLYSKEGSLLAKNHLSSDNVHHYELGLSST